jgi:shikimate dehydrogenase
MRKFGLIGYPLTHSFSERYFTEKFIREGIRDCSYAAYELSSLGGLPALLADPELLGLNVTIPYKESVLPFVDSPGEVVRAVGACNCIRIVGGKLEGYNTDVIGFEQSLVKKLQPHHTQALVLGTGGAAKAVGWVLEKLGIGYRFVSRKAGGAAIAAVDELNLPYEDVDGPLLLSHTLLINTTPIGMYPKTEACPPLPYEVLTDRHYLFDLVYNPERTLFLRKGAARGATVENGYEMLILQAEESWRIWNE